MQKTKQVFIAFFLSVSVLLLFNSRLFAQKKFTVELGIENSLPLGQFKQYYTYGLGATAELNLRLNPVVKLFFSASYLDYFINQKNLGFGGTEDFIPLVFGGKFMVLPKIYLVAGGGINLDLGNVIDVYKIYRVGLGKEFHKRFAVELKYERTGQYDFTPKVIKLGASIRL